MSSHLREEINWDDVMGKEAMKEKGLDLITII
jgi:hypothetical protein